MIMNARSLAKLSWVKLLMRTIFAAMAAAFTSPGRLKAKYEHEKPPTTPSNPPSEKRLKEPSTPGREISANDWLRS